MTFDEFLVLNPQFLTWSGFNTPVLDAVAKNTILDGLRTLYANRPGLFQVEQPITIVKSSDWVTSTAILNDRAIGPITLQMPVSFGAVSTLYYFDQFGNWSAAPIWRTLAHELSHGVTSESTLDPQSVSPFSGSTAAWLAYSNVTANADHLGGAEVYANLVMQSLDAGTPKKQSVSYFLSSVNGPSIFKAGESYTFGQSINNGVWLDSLFPGGAQQGYTVDRCLIR